MASVGAECGVCLRPFSVHQGQPCPSEQAIAALASCDATHQVHELCEADGECGTSRTLNNCGSHDVYERCLVPGLRQPPWSPPRPPAQPPNPAFPPSPPRPPFTPLQPCEPGVCVAGIECGMCLRRLGSNADDQPCPDEGKVAALPMCLTGMRLSAECEGDGECGTDRTLNNCLWHDIYVREACIPPAPLTLTLAPSQPGPNGGVIAVVVLGLLALALALAAYCWVRRRSASGRRKSFNAMLGAPLSAGVTVNTESTFQVHVASPLSGMPRGMPAEVRRVGGEDGL